MHYRSLGTTGIQVSEIGFGCMSLSTNSEKENIDLLHQAAATGINYFDTADLYDKGMNETIVGKALKEIRHKIVLATKVGNQWRSDGSGWDWNPRKEYILKAAEESLRRLQTDHIDLYQLHGGTIDDPIDDTIEAFEQLKKQGKIRHYGISSIRPNVIREYIKRSSVISVMMQYSLLDRRPEESILDLLQQHTISVLARGALAQGLLVNKPAKEYLDHSKEEVARAAKAIAAVSGTYREPSQTAIQYVLNHPAVASAIVGIRNSKQLKEVTPETVALQKEEIKLLQRSIRANRYEQHR
ncbi:MAG: aldo/keto reductase [Bacteroidota bacterium]|nr:aldo/keto reductase [Bacteroidota bacterium]